MDIEIAMYRNAGIVVTDTIPIAPGTIVILAMEVLLKCTVSEKEGGRQNACQAVLHAV
ncbi:MAG: hypothetical protein M3299_07385 [Thermoproteota archaeon]|nr:hypothetical protein [Thermoproteota archaeon]